MRIGRFAAIGIASTLLYAALAHGISVLTPLPAAAASLLAFAAGAVFSYFGHRMFTFRSKQSHGQAVSRFAGVNLLAYLVALFVPLVLSDVLGYRPLVSFGAVCVIVPVMNFVLLNVWVFRPHAGKPQDFA